MSHTGYRRSVRPIDSAFRTSDTATPLPISAAAAGGDHPITFNAFANAQSFSAFSIAGTIAPAALVNASTFPAFAVRGNIGFSAFSNAQAFGAFALAARIDFAAFAAPQSFSPFALNGVIGFAAFSNAQSFATQSVNATIAPAAYANAQAFPQFTVETGTPHPITFGAHVNVSAFAPFTVVAFGEDQYHGHGRLFEDELTVEDVHKAYELVELRKIARAPRQPRVEVPQLELFQKPPVARPERVRGQPRATEGELSIMRMFELVTLLEALDD
jgi:hypothetical protein